jgi:hypothetical protein
VANEVMETVAIKAGNSYAIINKKDFDEKTQQLYDGPLPRDVVTDLSKNPDGTFSQPTPTDIRFPDKNLTEFANNHRSGMSAHEARVAAKLPDAPGGLQPDPLLAEQVKADEESKAAAAKEQAEMVASEEEAAAARSAEAKKPASKK